MLVPLAVALIAGNGLSATAVLLPAGLLYLAVAFVCNRVAGTPFGDTRFLRIGAQARAAALAR